MRKSALITASAFIGLASLVAGGTAASASSAPAPKVAGASSFTLNLLGAPITVGVTTGVDGSLTNVNVDPTVLVATAARINKVSFSNVAGTASVTVRANHGGQSVAIRSTSLADLAGIANGWTGDVFGNDVKSSVTFDVVDNAGSPELANVDCLPGGTITCSDPVTTSGHDDDDDDGSSVSSSVTFTSETGATRTLRIRVGMHTDDGNTQAVVRISLSRITEPAITGVGLHTWTGVLCDSTPANIDYRVEADGSITVENTTNPAFTSSTSNSGEHGGVTVTFTTANSEQVRIRVQGADLTVRTRVNLHCPQDLPTINSIAPDPSIVSGDDDGDDDHGDHSDDDDDDDHGDDHGGDRGGSRGGNGGSDDVKGHG